MHRLQGEALGMSAVVSDAEGFRPPRGGDSIMASTAAWKAKTVS